MMNRFNLEDRLINFAVTIIGITAQLDNTKACSHIGSQLLRSGTSPALNYGEAQSAESRKDFVHKMTVALKELRETSINLKIIARAGLSSLSELDAAKKECNELIAIFVKSIGTARKKLTNPEVQAIR